MKSNTGFIFSTILALSSFCFAQQVAPTPPPATSGVQPVKVDGTAVPREKRAAAYRKLLEGQRYIWKMRN